MNPQFQKILQQVIQAFQRRNFNEADSILKELLRYELNSADTIFEFGIVCFKTNRLAEALVIFQCLQPYKSDDVRIPYNLGLIHSLEGMHQLALDAYDLALKIQPNDAETLINKGSTYIDIKNYVLALDALNKAIQIRPNIPEAWSNKGIALSNLNLYEESIHAYNEAIKLNPRYHEAWSNKSVPLNKLKRFLESSEACDKALSLKPDYAEAWFNKGNALHELKRYDEALSHYDEALSLKPDYAEALFNKGNALHELKRYDEALDHFDKVLSLRADYQDAWFNKGEALNFLKKHSESAHAEVWFSKGATLQELKRYDEAMTHYDKVLSLKPDYIEALFNKGAALQELKRYDEALDHFDKVLILKSDYHDAWHNKGEALNFLKRHSESAVSYFKALELKGGDSYLLGKAHHQMMLGCDWTNYEKNINDIFHLINEGKMSEPFGFQGISNSEALTQKCAEIYSNDRFPALGNLFKFSQYRHRKIRVGYLCGEFRNQATSILMTRIWELHNKSKFEIFAFDNGWDDGSDYRQRIVGAFDNIFDISKLSDLDAVKLIQSNEIDILINLNGFFGLSRQGIFSYKPAPIQVNYLGFPGTIGAKYMDYIIADKVVIPEESKKYYVEKLVYLPNSYQANDDQRKISDRKFTRRQLGLPEDAFVFACFNNNYKITPSTFDSWMRILFHVRGGVLWLLADNPIAKENLIKEAAARGIDSSRLIFAERLSIEEHLARHDLADLFLDTLPYNAHTTCSDALWAGLPVLTIMGGTFPGRVSASLLTSLGLDELITSSEEQYEALAIELVMKPKKLADIKLKLANNRLTTPLFNATLFTKHLEAAYTKMYERYQNDMQPDHILVGCEID
jgi:predicted O-linked N-acetylglucosamine transferase (SPINDLY family)